VSENESAEAGFTHLHLHTEYSLLDGAIRIKALAARLKELGMTSCAITDHGVMYGTVEFYQEMKKAGIHPIIGCECYVAPRSRFDKEGSADREPNHLVLLAKDNEGLKNLNRLVSAGFTDGFYYRPRIDKELLQKYSGGLIALSACLGGEIASALMNEQFAEARETALWYDSVFGRGNYYLEIQSNTIPAQARVNSHLIRISQETGIPLAATNDCHYMLKEDAKAHDVLLCMQTGKHVSDRDRMRMPTDDFYLKSEEEMRAFFPNLPSAIENTARIAAMCQAEYTFDKIHLPRFDLPDSFTDHVLFLKTLAAEGLKKRLADLGDVSDVQVYYDRLEYELSVITAMGYTDYYLIVWDFIKYARDHGIMVGPGRGSGAGSLVAYAVAITNIDPIRYGLIFERFLNNERVSMPDFDVDFCYERRGEVIQYVTAKYGEDRVAQVITFGTLAARACVRDVARALEMPYAESDHLAKLIPFAGGMKIAHALEISPDLMAAYKSSEAAKDILDTAMLFEGMPRHASTHAAGVVISSDPLTDLAPLSKNDESIVVQFDKNKVEAIGLLKFDFLGLRTLTVMRDTAEMVLQSYGVQLDYDHIPMDEPEVYEMIGRGDTEGIFQLESSGMTSFMMELAPNSIEDIVAGISLYRPGPMEQIPRYVASRHDPSSIRYEHPLLEPILNVSYGCMIYQEQAMQIVRDVAGFSMGQSDNIRRAMSKKKPEIMEKYRQLFVFGGTDEKGRTVDGAVNRGVPEKTATKIFDDVSLFSGYAFNKSHAAAYAVIAYITAHLKYHYPTEFMAAMLNSFRGNLPQTAWYIGSSKKMGLKVLPPDINRSMAKFTTEGRGFIRIGLSAVKNVGEGAILQLVNERTEFGVFKTYGDFLRRVFRQDMNKKMIESLILASALDCFGIQRTRMIASLDPFYAQLSTARRNEMDGQISLFGLARPKEDLTRSEPQYPELDEYSVSEKLMKEKEVLGLYVSGHPLEAYKQAIDFYTNADSSAFVTAAGDEEVMPERSLEDKDQVRMAGLLISKTTKTTKNQDVMAFLQVEDLLGGYEVIVFPKTYQANMDIIRENKVLLIRGRVSIREDEAPKLIAESITELPSVCTGSKAPPILHQKSYPENNRWNGQNGAAQAVRENGKSTAATAFGENKKTAAAPVSRENPGGGTSAASKESVRRLCIRYLGSENDECYQRILKSLEYFHGTMPVIILIASTRKRIELPVQYAVEPSDAVLKEIAGICGAANMAIF
jgi:DNA polymerase III subunit alpha